MIEDIRIYGNDGIALFNQNGQDFIISSNDDYQIREVHPKDLSELFDDSTTLYFDSIGKREDIVTCLKNEKRKLNALFMTISSFNPDISPRARDIAINGAQKRLCDSSIADFVKGRLFAYPIPNIAYLTQSCEQYAETDAQDLFHLLQEMIDHQIGINHFAKVWSTLCQSYLKEHHLHPTNLRHALADKFVFYKLATADFTEEDNVNFVAYQIRDQYEFNKDEEVLLDLLLENLPDQQATIEENDYDDEEEWEDDEYQTKIERIKPTKKKKTAPSQVISAEPETPYDQVANALKDWPQTPTERSGDAQAVLKQIDFICDEINNKNEQTALPLIAALIAYQKKHSRKEDMVKSLCHLAKAMMDIHWFDPVEGLLNLAANFYPSDPLPNNQLANSYLRKDKIDQAILLYKQNSERFPNDVVTQHGLAECYRQQGKIDKAILLYKQTSERFPDNVVAQNGLAECYRQQGKVDQAILLYKQTSERFPNEVVAQTGLAECHRQQGKIDKAILLYKQTSERFPNEVVAQTGLAECYRQQGKINQAILHYKQTSERFPDNVVAQNGLAECYRQQGKVDQAILLYKQTSERFPDNVVAQTGLAECYRQQGKIDKAILLYKKTSERFPNEVVAQTGLAECYRQQGKIDQAILLYKQTSERFPDNVVAQNGLAECYRQQGKVDQAILLYKQTSERFPDNVVAQTGLAECFKQQGKINQAILHYKQASKRFPDNVVAQTGLAECYRQQGKIDQAILLYKQTSERFPNEVVPQNGLAECYRQQGKIDQAIQLYKQTSERFPDNVVAQTGLASLYVSQKEFQKAEALLSDKPCETRDDWIGFHIRAMICLKQGDLAKARYMFQYGLDNVPFFDEIKYFKSALAVTQLRMKDYQECLNLIRLDQYVSKAEKSAAQIIHTHAFAGLEQKQEAENIIHIFEGQGQSIRLMEKISQRYGLSNHAIPDSEVQARLDEEIYDAEIDLIMDLSIAA